VAENIIAEAVAVAVTEEVAMAVDDTHQ